MGFFNYIKNDIWHIPLKGKTRFQRLRIQLLKLLFLVAQGFTKKQIQQGASSLTYYSLLAFVPLLILFMAITRGILSHDLLHQWLASHLADQQEIVSFLIKLSEATISQFHKSMLAISSLLLALWAGIKVLTYIELSMNQTWEVRIGRTFSQRFSDYLAMLFLCPLVVIFSTFFTLVSSLALSDLGTNHGGIFGEFSALIYQIFNIIPIVLNCLLFTFLFIFIPTTHVRFVPALWAGVISGVLYQIVQWIYFSLQIGVSRYSILYGTFAALPLFVISIHVSWVIILIGSKLAFALQNVSAYDVTDMSNKISKSSSMLISLRIMQICLQNFYERLPPVTANYLSQELHLSLSVTLHLLSQLVDANLLSEVHKGDSLEGYYPAFPPEQMTIKTVIDMIDNQGEKINLPPDTKNLDLEKTLQNFSSLIEKSEQNRLLKDI